MSSRAVVGLGANLGDRRARIGEAAQRIGEVCPILCASSLFECDAVGPPQPRYLNAAILLALELEPETLLRELLEIERQLGRERWGPRLIDLDILFIDGVSIDRPGLIVPHPRLAERTFALAPLLEVLPGAEAPSTGQPYADCLGRLSQPELTRVAFPDDWCSHRNARNHG